jgi:hypothetical protein
MVDSYTLDEAGDENDIDLVGPPSTRRSLHKKEYPAE